MRNPLVITKILLMVVALAGVLYVMRSVNQDGAGRFLQALGVEPGTQQSPGLQPSNRKLQEGEESHNICPTRIKAITWADGRAVQEHKEGLKMRWQALEPGKPEPRDISYLEVEKWLSLHCQIAIKPVLTQTDPPGPFTKFLTIQYVDGTENVIAKHEKVFKSDAKLFTSEDFESALADLERIAIFPAKGT